MVTAPVKLSIPMAETSPAKVKYLKSCKVSWSVAKTVVNKVPWAEFSLMLFVKSAINGFSFTSLRLMM